MSEQPVGRAVLAALLYLPGGATSGELARLIAYARNTVQQSYGNLRHEALIEPGDGKHRWRLSPLGRDVAGALARQPAARRIDGPPPAACWLPHLTEAEADLVLLAIDKLGDGTNLATGQRETLRALRTKLFAGVPAG